MFRDMGQEAASRIWSSGRICMGMGARL